MVSDACKVLLEVRAFKTFSTLLLSDNRCKRDKATRIRHCVHQVGSSCELEQEQPSLQGRRWLRQGLKQAMEQEMEQEQLQEQTQALVRVQGQEQEQEQVWVQGQSQVQLQVQLQKQAQARAYPQ